MPNLTDSRYIQKSKLFLLPLVELKKDIVIKPKGTYVIDPVRGITEQDCRLIVPYEIDNSSEFSYYEDNFILRSKYLDNNNYYETDTDRVYVFDLSEHREDFMKFLQGKYTDFTTKIKGLINIYWGIIRAGKFIPHEQIEAYLSPVYSTFKRCAEELNMPVSTLLQVGQLIDPPDLERETFRSSIKYDEVKMLESEDQNQKAI